MEEANGLVPIGQLDTYNNFDPNGYFGSIYDAESAKRAVGKVKVLEEYLKAADQYGEYAAKFCLLEAQMYVQIAQVDGSEDQLTEAKRRLVRWIRSKTDEEMAEILEEVATGIRIMKIERRENDEQARQVQRKDIDSELKRISDQIVTDAEKNGITKLSPTVFHERWRMYGFHPNKDTIKGYVESTRDRLLNKNILGIGDGEGTYVNPVKCDRDTISQVVETRLESIYADISSLSKICRDAKFSIPEQGITALHASIDELAAV